MAVRGLVLRFCVRIGFVGAVRQAGHVDLWAAPIADTRPLFDWERRDLLSLLADMTSPNWSATTAAGTWTVKDVALHLLDGDLTRLSAGRDHDATGLLPTHVPASEFAALLATKNQRWINAAQHLSGRVIRDLLADTTERISDWTANADLRAPAQVSWAADEPVPAWLDLAREFTETWVHHQQIRHALGRSTDTTRLGAVLHTFIWALPHQYRASASPGTTVNVNLAAGGSWTLRVEHGGRWTLHEGSAPEPQAVVTFTDEAAWRSLVGAAVPQGSVTCVGPARLTDPVLQLRGIIA